MVSAKYPTSGVTCFFTVDVVWSVDSFCHMKLHLYPLKNELLLSLVKVIVVISSALIYSQIARIHETFFPFFLFFTFCTIYEESGRSRWFEEGETRNRG